MNSNYFTTRKMPGYERQREEEYFPDWAIEEKSDEKD